jgi:putative membrane protein
LTLPLNVLTLGLFTFVVNAIILKLCAAFLPRFEIEGFFPAVVGAFVLALVNMGLHAIFV